MRFISYNKTDSYYEFTGENGEKLLIPSTSVITIDDESGAISIKTTCSRQTIGYLLK